MRQLFWKELHELRLLPLNAATGVALLTLGVVALEHADSGATRINPFDTFIRFILLLLVWFVSGLIAGAGAFAPEVGSGTLQFLSALPVSRRRLWSVKVLAAASILLACVLASTLTWGIIEYLLVGAAFTQSTQWLTTTGLALDGLVALGFLAAALATSPFLDRALSTVVAALLVSLAGAVVLENFADRYMAQHYSIPVLYSSPAFSLFESKPSSLQIALALLSIFVCASVSFWTFTHGEDLRSDKRFRVGAHSGVASVAVALLAFWAGSWMHWW